MGLFDTLFGGGSSSGGSSGFGWGSMLTPAIAGIAGYLMNKYSTDQQSKLDADKYAFTAEQNQLARDASMEELKLRLAEQAAASGAGAANQAAQIKAQAALGGGNLVNNAYANWIGAYKR